MTICVAASRTVRLLQILDHFAGKQQQQHKQQQQPYGAEDDFGAAAAARLQQQQQQSGSLQDLDFVGFPTDARTLKKQETDSKASQAEDLDSLGWPVQGAAGRRRDTPAAKEAPNQDLEFVGFAQGNRQETFTQSSADTSRPGPSRRRLQQQQQSGGVQDLEFVGFPTEKQTRTKQGDGDSKASMPDDLESVGWLDQGAAEKKGDPVAGQKPANQDLEFVGFPGEDRHKTFDQVYWVCDAAWPKEHHEQVSNCCRLSLEVALQRLLERRRMTLMLHGSTGLNPPGQGLGWG